MIDKNITVSLYDDRLKSLLSRRGCFPINFLIHNYQDFKDVFDGLPPSPSQDIYRCIDIIRCLGNIKRSNFIELLWGIPKEEIYREQANKLF